MNHYRYEVVGITGDGKPWTAKGMISNASGNFGQVPNAVMLASFDMLTKRQTTFGKPGEGECRGPYTIHRMVIEQVFEQAPERPVGEALQ